MKLYIVAMRDIATNCYGPPTAVTHLGSAIRNFEDQCTGVVQGDPTLRNHPEHFELYQVGTYDDTTGEFVNDKLQLSVGANHKPRENVNITRVDRGPPREIAELPGYTFNGGPL